MAQTAPYYPIIYIRGFAATMSEIENTVATPYMGFNLGSTKLRQDYEGKPTRFIFESPLIRLIKDYGYSETYHNGDLIDNDYVNSLSSDKREALNRSIWVFRYYETVSKDLGDGKKLRIPEFARDLERYILTIRDLLCKTKAEKDKFKVYLVAHSMGGLIARCYLQTLAAGKSNFVDKVFTYATPHNGIDLMGINSPNLGFLDKLHVSNFNRKVMKKYLKLSGSEKRVNTLDKKFDPERFFSFVGTNYKDYNAFFKVASKATGELSDGLVMMENAYVYGSPRAYAHRSHSGHYGIVNSEEGYQNLSRFLFGQVRVKASLQTDDITLPRKVYDQILKRGKPDFKRLKASYYVESTATIRGEQYNITERVLHQESAMRKDYDGLCKKQLTLFTGYLKSPDQTKTVDGKVSFAVRVGIQVPTYEIDKKFWFDAHYEGQYILFETVVLTFDPKNKQKSLTYRLAGKTEDKEKALAPEKKGTRGAPDIYRIPLGFDASLAENKKPAESFSGSLLLAVSPWNNWHK